MIDYDWPSEYDFPFDHQIHTTMFMLKNTNSFVLNDMGTGKTLSALWACDYLMNKGAIKKVLIACPLSTVISVWGKSIFKNLLHRKYEILHGSRAVRLNNLSKDVDFYIINHDGFKSIGEELAKAKFDIIIIDELTAFKTHTTKRWKAANKVMRPCKGLWGMTGNPTPNAPTEAFGQAKLINPTNTNLPKYFSQFRQMTMTQINMYTWSTKPDCEETVAKILTPAIRYVRDDCIDLPPCTIQDVDIEMSKEQAMVYKDLMDEYVHEYAEGRITAANAAVKTIKLLQVSAGCVYNDDRKYKIIDCKPKLDYLWNQWEGIKNGKFIIFSAFKGSIEMLMNYAEDKKIRAAFINGDVSLTKRSNHIDRFQDGNLEWLVLQPQAASHGLTLTAAHNSTWFTPIASGEVYQQANARITRPGQLNKQLITRMSCSKAEKRIFTALDRKEKMSDAILDLFT